MSRSVGSDVLMKSHVRLLSAGSLVLATMLALSFLPAGCSSSQQATQPDGPVVHEPPAEPPSEGATKGTSLEREPATGEEPDAAG